MSDIILEAKKITKYFHDPLTVQVLKEISFSINRSDFVSVIGKSGCGKSTLLYILSTMDTDYEGELFIDGVAMRNRKESELAKVRNEKIGFVFQFHYLLNEFSVLKNVMLPGLKLGKYSDKEVEHRAMEKLKILGIDNEALKNPNQLSGGQKQRVSIARAIVRAPKILMLDDALSAVDTKTENTILNSMKKIMQGRTSIIISHRVSSAKLANKIIVLNDGFLVEEGTHESLLAAKGVYYELYEKQMQTDEVVS